MACSASFQSLQATMSQNVLTSKFTINQLHVDFITKDRKHHPSIIKWDSLKLGITNWDRVLQSGTTFISKWGNNYKVMQYRRKMGETGESNRFLQLAPLFTQHFTPRNS